MRLSPSPMHHTLLWYTFWTDGCVHIKPFHPIPKSSCQTSKYNVQYFLLFQDAYFLALH